MKTGWRATFSRLFPATKADIEKVLMKLSDLQATLAKIDDQLDKAKTEIVTTINDLKAQLGNVDIPADAQASLDRLTSLATALDDIVPDSPTAPPTTPPTV